MAFSAFSPISFSLKATPETKLKLMNPLWARPEVDQQKINAQCFSFKQSCCGGIKSLSITMVYHQIARPRIDDCQSLRLYFNWWRKPCFLFVRIFFSLVIRKDLAYKWNEWKRGWLVPCFDTGQTSPLFLCKSSFFLCQGVYIYMRKTEEFVLKQDQQDHRQSR